MFVDINNTDKKYNIIYMDPPWRFSQGINPRKTFNEKGKKEELNLHYDTMSDDEIRNFKFSQIADDECVVLCWTTDAHLPIALDMLKNNGFTYKTIGFVWDKQKAYMGKWNVKQCEICLLATKGTAHKLLKSFKARQLISEPKTVHSAKPKQMYDRINEMFGNELPRIELFARIGMSGWDWWGNQSPTEETTEINISNNNKDKITKSLW